MNPYESLVQFFVSDPWLVNKSELFEYSQLYIFLKKKKKQKGGLTFELIITN